MIIRKTLQVSFMGDGIHRQVLVPSATSTIIVNGPTDTLTIKTASGDLDYKLSKSDTSIAIYSRQVEMPDEI